jgi:hypothetical protein
LRFYRELAFYYIIFVTKRHPTLARREAAMSSHVAHEKSQFFLSHFRSSQKARPSPVIVTVDGKLQHPKEPQQYPTIPEERFRLIGG